MMNKKGQYLQFILAVSLIAGLLTILSISGVIDVAQITGVGGYIDRPVFKYVKCEAISGYVYSTQYNIREGGQWITKPSATDKYDLVVRVPDPFLRSWRVIVDICNSQVISETNCRSQAGDYTVISGNIFNVYNVRPEEEVHLEYQEKLLFAWKSKSGATYQVGFVPFGLREYDFLSGSSAPVNPNDCEVSSVDDSWKDRLLGTNIDGIAEKVSQSTNERILQPNEVRWYVSGYVTSKAESFVLNYKGNDAWCRSTGTSGEIYRINTVQLGSGTYRVASADWSDYLGTETCCPKSTIGDKVCNDNFQWEIIQGSECGIFKSCGSPDWVPYSENQIIKYSCVNGFCESEIKAVECASDFDCKDANEICDLNNWICVNANVDIDGQIIETIPDNAADCEARGGIWVTEETEKKTFGSFLGISEPKIITQEYCKFRERINWLRIILIVGGLALIFVFRNKILAGGRWVLGKIGVKI